MKASKGQGQRSGWSVRKKVGFVLFLVTGVAIAMLLIYGAFDQDDGDGEAETSPTPPPVETQAVGVPTPTPQVSLTPLVRPPENDYYVGQVLKVPMTYELCREPDPPEGPNGRCNLWNHVHQGDCVRIAHRVRIFDQSWGDTWYWLVEVILGGVYTQGEFAYVADWAILEPVVEEQCVRQVPNFQKGEVVEAGYNLELGDAPAGNAVGFDDSGEPLKIFGGHKATITVEPVLGPDGFYWCKIQPYDDLPEGWVTCEFMKLE